MTAPSSKACSPPSTRRSPRSAPTRPTTASTAMPPSSRSAARPVIPPRKGAAIRPPPRRNDAPPTRGAAVARIAEVGRDAWKAETGYHRRSLAETAMLPLQDPHRPEPPLPRLRPPEGRGRRRRALHQPLHRPRHAPKHQDRIETSRGKGRSKLNHFHATTPPENARSQSPFPRQPPDPTRSPPARAGKFPVVFEGCSGRAVHLGAGSEGTKSSLSPVHSPNLFTSCFGQQVRGVVFLGLFRSVGTSHFATGFGWAG